MVLSGWLHDGRCLLEQKRHAGRITPPAPCPLTNPNKSMQLIKISTSIKIQQLRIRNLSETKRYPFSYLASLWTVLQHRDQLIQIQPESAPELQMTSHLPVPAFCFAETAFA